MMRLLKLVSLVFLSVNSMPIKAQVLKWQENRPLTWDDFQGKPNYWEKPWAVTYGNIGYHYNCERKDSTYIITFTLESDFFQKWSWAKYEHREDWVLTHEQLHFDIYELYTRKLAMAFKSYTYTGNYKTEIDSIYKKIWDECRKMHAKYDAEATNDRSMLFKWQLAIYLDLKALPRNY